MVEVQNTPHHKLVIKARNENYHLFKERFEGSVKEVMETYNELRAEELRFEGYWNENLQEITIKHI